jgi:hypothetical protein
MKKLIKKWLGITDLETTAIHLDISKTGYMYVKERDKMLQKDLKIYQESIELSLNNFAEKLERFEQNVKDERNQISETFRNGGDVSFMGIVYTPKTETRSLSADLDDTTVSKLFKTPRKVAKKAPVKKSGKTKITKKGTNNGK